MKLICIGRNYADHAKELGNKVPSEPLFFLKPDSAILPHRHPFYIPEWTQEVHYEVELLVRITRNGKSVALEFAHRYYEEVSLGIDFTARDVQSAAKSEGHPWEKAKAFDGSAVVSREWIAQRSLGRGMGARPVRIEEEWNGCPVRYSGIHAVSRRSVDCPCFEVYDPQNGGHSIYRNSFRCWGGCRRRCAGRHA